MIREVTMFAMFCDNCGKQHDDDYSAWTDEIGAKEAADESGWYNENDRDYCPTCYSFDDDDNLVLKTIEP